MVYRSIDTVIKHKYLTAITSKSSSLQLLFSMTFWKLNYSQLNFMTYWYLVYLLNPIFVMSFLSCISWYLSHIYNSIWYCLLLCISGADCDVHKACLAWVWCPVHFLRPQCRQNQRWHYWLSCLWRESIWLETNGARQKHTGIWTLCL